MEEEVDYREATTSYIDTLENTLSNYLEVDFSHSSCD